MDSRNNLLAEEVSVVDDETASVGSLSDVDVEKMVCEIIVVNRSSIDSDLSGHEANSLNDEIRAISPVHSDFLNYEILVLEDPSFFESEAELISDGVTAAEENTLDSAEEDGNLDQIPLRFTRVRFSNSVKSKIASCRTRFFHSLPLEKQIILLRRSENLPQQTGMSHVCADLAHQLSAQLKLHFQSVYSWLIRRYRMLKNIGTSISPKHLKYLVDEFKLSPVLSDERALLLGYVLQAPVGAIRRWFQLKRSGHLRLYHSGATPCHNFEITENGVSEEEPASPWRNVIEDDPVADPTVKVSNNGVLTPRKRLSKQATEVSESTRYLLKEHQLEILFQAFKRCPNLNPASAEKLSKQSDVPKQKIYGWFQQMHKSLAKIPSLVLQSSYRNQNLRAEQIEVLESEYRIHSYPNEAKLNLLADLLDVEKNLIKRWFLSRRCHDIVFHSSSSSDNDDKANDSTSSLPNLDPDTAGQGSYTPARSEASHFLGVLDVENSLFSDEDPLDQPEEPASLTKDVFEFEEEDEPIIPLVLQQKDSKESVTDSSSDVSRVAAESTKKRPLTPLQRMSLRKEYRKSAYITPDEAQRLAVDLELSVSRVKSWFERMRLREKNQGTGGSASKVLGPKMRSPLTLWQKRVLQEEYNQNHSLTKRRLRILCDKLKASQSTIILWFREQNNAQK